MRKDEIQTKIDKMDKHLSISEIEKELGMPRTTLQKVLKGKRELPKKWVKVVENYFLSRNKVPLIPLTDKQVNDYKKSLVIDPKNYNDLLRLAKDKSVTRDYMIDLMKGITLTLPQQSAILSKLTTP
jgi:transcriptional regulator with XRE-family HTH domain